MKSPTFFYFFSLVMPRLLVIQKTFRIFAAEYSPKYVFVMCTITLEYNQNSALARRKLAALLATGLFIQKEVKPDEPTPEEVEAHRQLRDAALEHSRKSMSPIIARYL